MPASVCRNLPSRALPAPVVGLFLAVCASACVLPATDSEFAAGTTPGGKLVIVGGGTNTPELWRTLFEQAGSQGRLVIIPTATDTGEPSAGLVDGLSAVFGASNVSVLHTADRTVADTEAFAAPLAAASAVWLDGGRQYRLADTYNGTRTHQALKALLTRGGVIGGTSAGATIQGDVMVRGYRASGTTQVGLNTAANQVVVAGALEGFKLMSGVVIDQHVTQRNRQNDLFRFYFDDDTRPGTERLNRQTVPDPLAYLGLGLDEQTAILVQGSTFRVWSAEPAQVGRQVRVFNPKAWPAGVVCQNETQCAVDILNVGDRYDVATRARL